MKYGIEVFGHTTKSNIKILQTLQNKSLKVLFNKDWYTPTLELHNELNMLKLDDNFNHSLLQIAYMQRNNLLPSIFDDFLILRSQIHNRQTRYAQQINIPMSKSKYGTNTLSYKGAKLYNNLPEEIKGALSLSSFKRKLKQYYLDRY